MRFACITTLRVAGVGDAGAIVAISVRQVIRQLDGSLLSKSRLLGLYAGIQKFKY